MMQVLSRPLPLYLLLCGVAALWIDFSRIHLGQTSDSLIPVLVSLQHWTPFYWEQSRFGMLVPLLAIPFDDPLVNLLVQDGLMIFSGLVAIGLLARFFVRSKAWFAAACGSCACLILFLAEPLRCDYFLAQPYGLSFALGLGALLLLDRATTSRPRWGLALGMILLASWVNMAVGPALLLLVAARWAGQRFAWRRAPVRLVALLLAGTTVGLVLERSAPFHDHRVTRLAPAARWMEACEALVSNTLHQGGPAYRRALLVLAAAATAAQSVAAGRRRKLAVVVLGATFAGTMALLVLAGTSRWTALNGHTPRYAYMALITLQTGLIASIVLAGSPVCRSVCAPRRPQAVRLRDSREITSRFGSALCVLCGLCVSNLKRRGRRDRRENGEVIIRTLLDGNSLNGNVLAAFCLLAATGWTYGAPSLATARMCLDERCGIVSVEILQSGCTHIAGDYWRVWPAVFHVNWTLHEQGATRRVWGVSERSLPTKAHWAAGELPTARIALLGRDAPHPEP